MRLAGGLHACRQGLFRVAKAPGYYFEHGWEASRKYWFSLIFISIITAKLLHIYSHLNSLPLRRLLVWGPTFFLQDAIVIFLARGLTRRFQKQWARVLTAAISFPFTLLISSMAAANLSFYVVTGAEIHWKQAHEFHRDAAAIRTLLTGLTGFIIVDVLFLVASWFATPHLYNGVGGVLRIWSSSVASLCCCCRKKQTLPSPEIYEQVARDDYEDDKSDDGDSAMLLVSPTPVAKETGWSLLKRFCVLFPTLIIILLRCVRPPDPSYWFLSKTLAITPFGGHKPHRHGLLNLGGMPGEYPWLGNRTALATPPALDWLPTQKLPGFEDWHGKGKIHYDPETDPLKISNLDGDVIEPLRKALQGGDVNIKHVIVIKLESTRQDVFPLRNESAVLDRIRSSYKNGDIPEKVETRLANLTRTSERLSGQSSGFGQFPVKPYGGISATNSFTAGTYTLKSLTASLCGVNPLTADFNREYKQHIYQPCLPHIFDALDASSERSNKTDDYKSWSWHSTFMMSVTEGYDNQNLLTPVLGFHDSVSEESINEDRANTTNKGEEVNYYGYPDTELRDYILDSINEAETKKERLFLTYLTGITHHPWGMPHDEYEEMIGQTWYGLNGHLNHYLNTIGFVDRWLGEIIKILEEAGIADETLLVTTGDHGVSLPNDGGVTPYDNPHVGNFHVPLTFNHPKLPAIQLENNVTSLQILPTILDLLIESSSMNDDDVNSLKSLLPLYEGQSMIRPLKAEEDGKEDWQFTVMNTGGTWLAVRSAAKPYRLVVPLLPDVEWRFTDLKSDPYEKDHLMEFDIMTLIEIVGIKYGHEAVKFVEDAAHVTQWWLAENWRRYEWGPEFGPPKNPEEDEKEHPYAHGHDTYHGVDDGPEPEPEPEHEPEAEAEGEGESHGEGDGDEDD